MYKGRIGEIADFMIKEGGMDPKKVAEMPLETFLEECAAVTALWNEVFHTLIIAQEEILSEGIQNEE
jgi:hypothetical protein